MDERPYPNLAGINYESMVDGRGVRTAIFLSGCSHHCPGCQNPGTWDPYSGVEITEDLLREIADSIIKRPFLSGITLTGGDPLYDRYRTRRFLRDLLKLLPEDRNRLNVWLYTGYTFEEVLLILEEEADEFDPPLEDLLSMVDVMVDGRFDMGQKDKRLKFRGSRNQRILNVKDSLLSHTPILLK